jgi:hypothetical protein
MNRDPRRGLPSAAERRRTNFSLNEDAERNPREEESTRPARDEAFKDVGPAEQSSRPRR